MIRQDYYEMIKMKNSQQRKSERLGKKGKAKQERSKYKREEVKSEEAIKTSIDKGNMREGS